MKVASNGVPGAVGQGRIALLPGLEVARVNGSGQVRRVSAVGRRANLEDALLWVPLVEVLSIGMNLCGFQC